MNSMTGFGRGEAQNELRSVQIEVSGVNRKQTEIAMNLPKSLFEGETILKQQITTVVSRGRVNVAITLNRLGKNLNDFNLDENKVKAYADLFQRIQEISHLPVDITMRDFLSVPDLLVQGEELQETPEDWLPLLQEALQKALEQFLIMRKTEGEHLKADLYARLSHLEELVKQMKIQAPLVIANYRDNLHRRLNEANIPIDLDDERLVKELGLFAEKCDIAEEFTRLDSHFIQFRLKSESSIPSGRPLDFLCQEIFREFNTIGSKANDAQLAHWVVEAKTELEKIREQVQNVE